MNEIPNEDEIHRMYEQVQKHRHDEIKRLERIQSMAKPDPFFGRQGYHSNNARFNSPSFRSQYFNVGEGIRTIAKGETAVLATLTVPAHHAGVMTGFSQYFADCKDDVVNSITWGIRINGYVPMGLQDFVGQFSSLSLPHAVYFPLSGGAETLGLSYISQGGSSDLESAATVVLRATNNWSTQVVLQGRLVGYTFPTAERNDEFESI